jgi:hypothetical protein
LRRSSSTVLITHPASMPDSIGYVPEFGRPKVVLLVRLLDGGSATTETHPDGGIPR